MRKAVAIPYVIALVLGIAVIGLIGFWFVSSGGKFGGQNSKTVCDNKFLQWCITHSGTYANFVSDGNPECNFFGSYNNCNELGVSGGGSGIPPTSGTPSGGDCGDPNTHGTCDDGRYCDGTDCVVCVSGSSPVCSGECTKCGTGWLCPFGGKCAR